MSKAHKEGLFQAELAPILSRHMFAATNNPEYHAEIYEALAAALGTAVAHGCRGNQAMMGVMLEGCCQHVMEIAAERQPAMAMLGQFRKPTGA